MEPLQLLMWSIILYVVGGVIALFLKKQEGLAILISGISAIIGGVLGVLSALPVILNGETISFAMAGPFDFAAFVVRMDMLGGGGGRLYGVCHFFTRHCLCVVFTLLCSRIQRSRRMEYGIFYESLYCFHGRTDCYG